ncbi:peptidase inhibitor family I36 protein [Streptomyces sp. NPDC006638]|uniref:peptidase inhibitor family I36 protein n=1 Tax=Streptomyces sp. NPDC006638 TaxID=3157183 RepID=UPI0033B143E9
MVRRFVTRLALGSAIAVSTLSALLPGHAAGAQAQAWACRDQQICLYAGPNGTGDSLAVTTDTGQLPPDWDDRARSVRNATDRDWCLYRSPQYVGELLEVAPDTAINLTEHFNESISSLLAKPDIGCWTSTTGPFQVPAEGLG